MARMTYSRPTRLLVSAMWMLQIFALSLFAVAPQADDYWRCVNSNDCSPRCFALWIPASGVHTTGCADESQNCKREKTATAQSADHCRFVLVDPDGDALSPLTTASLVAPNFHTALLPVVWPLDVPSLPEAAMPSLTRRGLPPSDVSRSPFSLRAPPLA